jgi:hypothetical protein
LVLQWIEMVEYIPCYSAPAVHWGLLPATRLASRKILVKQNIKKRTGPALCVLCGSILPTYPLYINCKKNLHTIQYTDFDESSCTLNNCQDAVDTCTYISNYKCIIYYMNIRIVQYMYKVLLSRVVKSQKSFFHISLL